MSTNFTVKLAIWPENAELIREIRQTVFVVEQGVDRLIEWDGKDQFCQHAIAISKTNEGIATGRILADGHIGRIAVLPTWRKQGVGSAILEKLISMARTENWDQVYLNSQTHAMGFYRRLGFVAEGLIFMEAGIAHQKMTLTF